jgi:hypothetical protein
MSVIARVIYWIGQSMTFRLFSLPVPAWGACTSSKLMQTEGKKLVVHDV